MHLALLAAAAASVWPIPQWKKLPLSQAEEKLEAPACQEFLQYMGLGVGRGTLRSDGLALIKGGTLLFSVNKEPFDEQRPHPIWSASKSVTSAMVGAAIHKGLKNPKGGTLSLEDPVSDYLQRPAAAPAEGAAAFGALKVRHLLEMGTGLQWSESYEAGIVGSNVLQMIYLSGYKDMADYVLRQPFKPEGPGKVYNYSSGDMSLVWAVLKKSCGATPGCDYDRLPWDLLFTPLGMGPGTAFEQDGAGVFVGSSYVFMSLLDMGRVGLLYMRDGMWGDKRILPEGYVKLTATPNQSYQSEGTVVRDLLSDGVYGLTWWLNAPAKDFPVGSYPSFPPDMYAALGHYGQLIVVVPSKDLVFIRTGADLEYNTKINRVGELLFPCLAQFDGGGA